MLDRNQVIAILKEIIDPYIPVNVWDLGLIYELDLPENEEAVRIVMTLASAISDKERNLPSLIKKKLEEKLKPKAVNLELVFEPIWNPDRMNEEARKKLGIEA